ncbi:MAG TPA: hypothetical protein DCM87_19195 [Planctomycetes bacterium]|nr:hypothetical protein [Planctomycetota bacterium]
MSPKSVVLKSVMRCPSSSHRGTRHQSCPPITGRWKTAAGRRCSKTTGMTRLRPKMLALIASTGASGPAFSRSRAASSGVVARPVTNSTLPRFFSASARRFSAASITLAGVPQL